MLIFGALDPQTTRNFEFQSLAGRDPPRNRPFRPPQGREEVVCGHVLFPGHVLYDPCIVPSSVRACARAFVLGAFRAGLCAASVEARQASWAD